MVKPPPRKQCAKCPWKVGVDPHDIPGAYCEKKHEGLESTIARGPNLFGPLRMMACHETKVGKELPCVGWLVHQLGVGNNLALRLAVFQGAVDPNVQTVGPQHERFEDTLPPTTGRRVLLGYRAKSLNKDGEVCEYTDPLPTRKMAARHLRKKRTFMSRDAVKVVTCRVYVWRRDRCDRN